MPPRVLARHLVRARQAGERGGARGRVAGVGELGHLRHRLGAAPLDDVQAVPLHEQLERVQHLQARLGVLRVQAADVVPRRARRREHAGHEPQDGSELLARRLHGVAAFVHERGPEQRRLLVAETLALRLHHRKQRPRQVQHPEQRLRVRGLLAEAEHDPPEEQIEVSGDELGRRL